MLTATKRKAVAKDVARGETLITPERLQELVNRHQSSHEEIAAYLEGMGFQVMWTPRPDVREVVSAIVERGAKIEPVPRLVVDAILTGSIFRRVDVGEDRDPKEVYVVTTLDRLLREREAIRRLFMGAAVRD
jgi:hypothetical protein